MSMTIEEFGTRLIHVINSQNKNPVAYITISNLVNSIQAAIAPRDSAGMPQFPKMLYRQSRTKTTREDDTLIVQNAQEQQEAEAQGWRTTPTPQPPGYPQYWVEVDPRKGTGYRRVMLRNRGEEESFKGSVDPANWVKDLYPNPALGGYPIDLDTLVAEHHAKLHQQLDAELKGAAKKESS